MVAAPRAALVVLALITPAASIAAKSGPTQQWSGTGPGNQRAAALAAESRPARRAWQFIRARVAELRQAKLRRQVQDLLDNPAPTYQLRAATLEERFKVLSELKAAGLLPDSTTIEGIYPPVSDPQRGAQSFLAAPGSYYTSAGISAGHHAYPGGLALHTAFNLRAALGLIAHYREQYQTPDALPRFNLDRDLVVAAVVLHDVMKTLVFQWNDDGSEFLEQRVADTGTHHVLGLAEQFARGLPPEVIIATAAAHNPPRPGELRKKVVGYLRAAAIIARVDPVQYGALRVSEDGFDLSVPALAEHFIVHLSDSDYLYSEFAAAATVDRVRALAGNLLKWPAEDLAGARFNWLRNTLLSMTTGIGCYQLLIAKGESALVPLIERAARRNERNRTTKNTMSTKIGRE